MLPKSSKRSYSILRRNSRGRESSSSSVSGLSSGEGSGVDPTGCFLKVLVRSLKVPLDASRVLSELARGYCDTLGVCTVVVYLLCASYA